jgi:hypothetical protein
LELFEPSLTKIRDVSDVCIVSCLTNFLASADGPESISQRVEPVLQRIVMLLREACERKPSRSFAVSPPMYRTTPVWYRDGLPEILSLFSGAFKEDRPKNLFLMSSFSTPEFDKDGIHLTAFSGLDFVVGLFDSAEEVIDRAKKSPQLRCDQNAESTRVLEDRMMVLEQDHRRLNQFVEKKSAVDSELADYRENERLEDSFVISGLPALPSSLSGKEWQQQAVSSVQSVIRSLVKRELEIVVVQNVTSRKKDSEVSYNVKMASVEDSRLIRRTFGAFFKGSKDNRPTQFQSISIKNRVTADTRIRISLMKLMAKRYRDSNPGAKVQVIGYDPRPLLKILPPVGASDRRTRVYNYIEACRALPTTFSSTDLDPILRRVHPNLRGSIRSTFIVLSDDMLRSRAVVQGEVPGDAPDAPAEPEATRDPIDPADVRRGIRRRLAESPPDSPSAKR